MTTRGEEAHEGRLDRVGAEEERRDVSVQVVDGGEGQRQPPGKRLGCRQTDEQRAYESGAARRGHELDVAEGRVGIAESLLDHGRHELEMAPGCHLRYDAAERRVQLGLRRDDIGEHVSVAGDEGRCRLVAGGLDPEDHAASPPAASRHMITASSRLSV